MIRSLLVLFCVFCVATTLSAIGGAGLLWFRGQLTPASLAEIRLILAGGEPEAVIADGSLTLPGESAAVVRVN